MLATTCGNFVRRHLARLPHLVEHGLGCGQREGKLLHRRRSRLLQMIGADIGRVPFRHLAVGVDDHVLDQPKRRRRREHIGAARQIFLEDVVLHRAGELCVVGALLLGERDVEREQPRRRRIDGHRGVHLVERNALNRLRMSPRWEIGTPTLPTSPRASGVVAVVAGLGRQVEGDRKPGLTLGKVPPVKLVGGLGGRMAGIGAEQPGLVSLG